MLRKRGNGEQCRIFDFTLRSPFNILTGVKRCSIHTGPTKAYKCYAEGSILFRLYINEMQKRD
jgi:hypothetical protein